MAILHRKEEKIQVVLGRLPQAHTDEEFVKMFIKLYGKDWGKIKAAYLKQSQDKEPGTVVTMPKPELYLKQLKEIYLKANAPKIDVPLEKKKKSSAQKVPTPQTSATETKKATTQKKTAIVETPTAMPGKATKVSKTVIKKEP